MIINLRGTSGSGKSTIVKSVISCGLGDPIAIRVLGRKQPIGYYVAPQRGPTLFIPGHYETPCGGCDTLDTLDQVYDLVKQEADNGCNVLYEGVMASGESRRCIELSQNRDIQVIALTTPIQDCINAIIERRAARNREVPSMPFNPQRTIRRADEVKRMMKHLRNAGVKIEWMSREEALKYCLKTLIGAA